MGEVVANIVANLPNKDGAGTYGKRKIIATWLLTPFKFALWS
jgi:hypothetical protein